MSGEQQTQLESHVIVGVGVIDPGDPKAIANGTAGQIAFRCSCGRRVVGSAAADEHVETGQ